MVIFRQVRRWRRADLIRKMNTPAGFVFWVDEPPKDVRAWLERRGKLPDIQAAKDRALRMTIQSITSHTSPP